MIMKTLKSLDIIGMKTDNFWLRILCIPTFCVFLAPHSFAQDNDLIVDPYSKNSNITFYQLMQNPYLGETFLQMQRRHLLEPVDQQVHTFIENNPEVKTLLNMLTEQFRPQLDKYVKSLIFNNVLIPIEPLTPIPKKPITPNLIESTSTNSKQLSLTEKYLRIQKIVEDIARDFGYSEEAIKNRLVFVANGNGQVNAFTVSPIQSNIVVVVNLELLDKLTESELRAVLAHEFGHIRAGHVANGILLRTLMNTSLRLLGSSGGSNQLVMSHDSHDHFVKYLNELNDQKLNGGSAGGISVQSIERYIDVNKETLIPKFIDLCIEIFKMSPGYSQEAKFFADLKEMKQRGSLVANDGEQLKSFFEVLVGVISRAQESSSDRFSSSQSHAENIASSMLKLSGVSPIATKGELRALLKGKIETITKLTSELSSEELREFNSNSHPVNGIRIQTIMNFPKVPDIYFANPFMKLLLLENELTSGVQSLERYIQRLKVASENLEKTSQGNESEDRLGVQKRIVELETINQSIQSELEKLRQSIVAKITALDLPQVNQKGTLLNINPRFENLLQFVTFNKLEIVQSLESIEKELALLNVSSELDAEDKERRVKMLNSEKQQLVRALNRFSFDVMSRLGGQYQVLQKRNPAERGQVSLANEISSQRLDTLRKAQFVLPLASGEGNPVIGSIIQHGTGSREAVALSELLQLNEVISGKPGRSKIPSFMAAAGDPQLWKNTLGARETDSSSIKSCKSLFPAK